MRPRAGRLHAVFAVDPGTVRSGVVVFDGDRVQFAGIPSNASLLDDIRAGRYAGMPAIFERMAGMGQRVGRTSFETAFWTGRFYEAAESHATLLLRIPRMEIKQHLLGTTKGKDKHVRRALLDRFGKVATTGCAGDSWAALAVAVTYWDRARGAREGAA